MHKGDVEQGGMPDDREVGLKANWDRSINRTVTCQELGYDQTTLSQRRFEYTEQRSKVMQQDVQK